MSLETALYWRLYRYGRFGLLVINWCLQVKAILARLEEHNIRDLKETQIEYALRSKSANGDPDKAFELLMLFEEALLGAIKEPDRSVKLVGAENRELVTCYLDSLLFAMYARLDSFEQILADNFSDTPRKKLATIIRLWVNMLRSGNLITTDITKHLQEALGLCGWEEATKLHQQDVSEAFTFITDKLDLPLLTLKMDVYHTGKDDADDHKIVRERLLDVAIPPPPEDGSEIKLEDCLEAYFNNKIEVKRHLQRRNTLQSLRSVDSKAEAWHLETVELRVDSPSSSTPRTPPPPFSPTRTTDTRRRGDSIFAERHIDIDLVVSEEIEKKAHDDFAIGKLRSRANTIRREVLMPAWQFFSLIRKYFLISSIMVIHLTSNPAWHTQDNPKTDVQVVQHFATKRPVLGICLKRYSVTAQGTRSRLNTYIDIPLEIGLPHFISDEVGDEFGSNFTNFKLSLQSVVCHRGNSLDSGHYIALVRSDPPEHVNHLGVNGSLAKEHHEDAGATTDDLANRWLRSDDLAPERVTYVDIKQALREECPYLLFYQVQPIADDLFRGDPPSYDSINLPKGPSQVESALSSAGNSSSELTNINDASTTEIGKIAAHTLQSARMVIPTDRDESSTSFTTTSPDDTPQTNPQPDTTIPSLSLNKTNSLNITTSQQASSANDSHSTLPAPPNRPHSIDLSTLERTLHAQSSNSLAADDAPRGRPSSSTSHDLEPRSPPAWPDGASSSAATSAKGGSSAPITPGDDPRAGYMAAAQHAGSRRNSRSWRNALRDRGSRPSSQSGEGRISFGMSRLKSAMSRDPLDTDVKGEEAVKDDDGEAVVAPADKEKEKGKGAAGAAVRRGKSLRAGKKRARSRSGVRALAAAAAAGAEDGGDGGRPDRECAVM